VESLSAEQARRVVLAAQGFSDPRPGGRVDRRHGRRVFQRTGLIQIDSVNVLVRSQELPLFARLGPHRRDLLPSMVSGGDLFEYWAHAACLIPLDHHHLYRWKMEANRSRWGKALERSRPGFLAEILAMVRDLGPVSAGDIREPRTRPKGKWWDWDHTKEALETLFATGDVTARRSPNFERVYDIPERMLPADVLERPTPKEADARKELLLVAARALGVATARDLSDYHYQKLPLIRPLLAQLVDDGRLLPVEVEGWGVPSYLHPEARLPRSVRAQALLSPFDSLMFDRARTERVFDFNYRLEIYVPAPKRVFGYYVLPFLLGDELVARVDLKADRAERVLRVQAAWGELDRPPDEVVGPLAAELASMAGWLGLDAVAIVDRGDLAQPLTKAVKALG
jgi:uncharacterized protein